MEADATAAGGTAAGGDDGMVAFDDLPVTGGAPLAAAASAAASSSEPEVMEMSATAKAAMEKHAATLMQLEVVKRARAIFVPADVKAQQARLRELGHPITLFGESPADRRERLKALLAEVELHGESAVVSASSAASSSSSSAAEAPAARTSTFYTPAPEPLKEARRFIADYSFERANRRLRAQAAVASSAEACAAEDRNAARLYERVRGMGASLSQAGDERPLTTCSISRDGSLIATGSWGATCKVWDAATTEQRCLLRGHKDRVVSVAWHPAAGLGRVRSSSAGSASDDAAASGGGGASAGHHDSWRPATEAGTTATHGSHSGSQTDSHLAGDRGLLVSGSIDGTAKIWRVPDAALQPVPISRARGKGVAASSASSSSAAGSTAMDADASASGVDDEAAAAKTRYDLLEIGAREVATLAGHLQRLCNVAWHPSGRYIGTTSFDKTWRLWDAETAKELLLQEGHAREAYAMAFHPDGSLAATGDLGGIGLLWDLRSGKSIMPLKGHSKQLLALDFSPNGHHLASGSDDNTVIIWELRQQKPLYTIPAHSHLIPRVKFSPVSGEYLVTCSYDGTLRTWNARDFAPLSVLKGHDGKVTCVDISADEGHIVSASFDRTFKVWSGPDKATLGRW